MWIAIKQPAIVDAGAARASFPSIRTRSTIRRSRCVDRKPFVRLSWPSGPSRSCATGEPS
jgi:hypothetical protein